MGPFFSCVLYNLILPRNALAMDRIIMNNFLFKGILLVKLLA